jgi:ADP-ribose pyrophosphatase YjhB (NUDIX family)
VITGVSAFVRWDNRLLLEVQKPHKWTTQKGQTHIGCGFIGGAVEPGESVREALQREAHEEIGCGLEVAEASGTTRICADQSIINTTLFDSAVLEWEARAAGYNFDGRVPVLSAIPLASPTPIDLPALLVVDLDLFCQVDARSVTVRAAQAQGASLIERTALLPGGLLYLANSAQMFHTLSISHPSPPSHPKSSSPDLDLFLLQILNSRFSIFYLNIFISM